MTGRRVVAGRYRLEERIGSGAMGVVWRGTDERLGRPVAIKQVFLHGGLDEGEADEVRQRTLREGRIAARLQHPHAISVFDASIDGDEPWLVMEYLPSRSLAAVLGEQGPLDPRQVARIGRQVADALDAAHQAGIVHRDVKPGNVLLGADGTVKITDFGISRASGDLTLTRTGMLAGTPAYLAPEVARGDDSTPASDVFSLGATLYAAVEGIPPFGADDNALALLHSVAAGAVNPPRQAGPMTALLMRLLRSEPGDRPTAAQARAELGRVAHAAPRAADQNAPGFPPAGPPGDGAGDGSPPSGDRPSIPPAAAGPSPTRHAMPGPTAPGGSGEPAERSNGVRPSGRRPTGSSRPTRTVAIIVLVLAVIAGAVVGGLVLGRSSGSSTSSAPAPGPAAPAATTTTTTAAAQPVDTSLSRVSAVRDYYALVTRDGAAGWARLGPAQQSAAGSFTNYQSFWSTIGRVDVPSAVAVDDTTIRATLVFFPNGQSSSTREIHDLGMVVNGRGGWMINSDRLLG